MPALLGWVKAFPEPKSYNLSIELVKQRAGNMDNNMLLDWGRLMWAAGAMTTGNNYLEYADAAIERGMPRIMLGVVHGNVAAERSYRRQGFGDYALELVKTLPARAG